MSEPQTPVGTPAAAIDTADAAQPVEVAGLLERIAELENATVNLRRALDTARVIGAAIGIIMERERMTAEQAFEALSGISQRRNLKVRDVAATIMLTGEY